MSATYHTASSGEWEIFLILFTRTPSLLLLLSTGAFWCVPGRHSANDSHFFYSDAHFVCSLYKFDEARILFSRLLFSSAQFFATFGLWQIYRTGIERDRERKAGSQQTAFIFNGILLKTRNN